MSAALSTAVLLVAVSLMKIQGTNAQSTCMTDDGCIPSLYKQYCCIASNSGKIIKLRMGDCMKTIHCPLTLLSSCSQQVNHTSCIDILENLPSALSGYYNIVLTNGSIATVYCDMEGNNCDGNGGWMRVGYVNMTEPGAICPQGLTQQQHEQIDHDLCGEPNPGGPSCNSTTFPTFQQNYTRVCGQVRGYQFGRPEAFEDSSYSIDSYYLHGVSITYDSSPRKHIWSYASGRTDTENPLYCPCSTGSPYTTPSFVGDDYYCESGTSFFLGEVLYASDPLWDGQDCNGAEGPCCTAPNMPWFSKTLNETTNSDLELRVCTDFGLPDEGSPIDIIELFVK